MCVLVSVYFGSFFGGRLFCVMRREVNIAFIVY